MLTAVNKLLQGQMMPTKTIALLGLCALMAWALAATAQSGDVEKRLGTQDAASR